MKLAIEYHGNKIAFASISNSVKPGEIIRQANILFDDISKIWTYSHIERTPGSNVGIYCKIKYLKK